MRLRITIIAGHGLSSVLLVILVDSFYTDPNQRVSVLGE